TRNCALYCAVTQSAHAQSLRPSQPLRNFRFQPRRLLVLLAAIGLALNLLAAPAWAHRNGCHRWHSCPSDTGSYVCGDLGYYAYCPGKQPTPVPYPTQCGLGGCPTPTVVVPTVEPVTCHRVSYRVCIPGARVVLSKRERYANGVTD